MPSGAHYEKLSLFSPNAHETFNQAPGTIQTQVTLKLARIQIIRFNYLLNAWERHNLVERPWVSMPDKPEYEPCFIMQKLGGMRLAT